MDTTSTDLNVKPGDKVWVSKYALSAGITLEEVRYCGSASKTAIVNAIPFSSLRIGKDCHATYEDAVTDAEKRRVAKIASLRKQIAKLEALTFAEVAP